MRKMLGAALVLGCVAIGLVGCSASSSPRAVVMHTPIPVGEDAALIAKRIKGCEDVAAGDVARGGPLMVSTATCTIDGHNVNINSWENKDATNLDEVLANDAHETFYARGDGWTVTLGDDPMLQYQLTNQADKLFQGALNGHTSWPTDPSAEQAVAKVAVASLGGTVHHFVP